MLNNLPPKTKIRVTESMYWNKFPFKLVFKFNAKSQWSQRKRYIPSNRTEGPMLRQHNDAILKGKEFRVNRLGQAVIYYVTDAETAQALVDNTHEVLNLTEVYQPIDADHVNFLIANPDKVTRFKLFHGRYHWTMRLSSGNHSHYTAMKRWCETHQNERGIEHVKFVFHENTHIVDGYFIDDSELLMVKLHHNQRTTRIKQVHILNKNNNKVGNSDEPLTLSETS